MEPYIGQVCLFGFNYAPRGWALCNGQLMSIGQNSALFSLLGTTFGGDGISTFALPDLRGRVAINQGDQPGLSKYAMGQTGGSETVTLNVTQMPQHVHAGQLHASNGAANQEEAQNHLLAETAVYTDAAANQVMNASAVTVGPTGGNQPHPNLQPYLTLNYCIALEGVYPPRT
ncbi:MAG: phage tail protein [Saprospiraceae bacterium]|nr:phage tail protein [Saprospiraceae bacterium]MBP6567423.1 phage tail protein [Saprospiraceae bacterium]